MKSLLVFLIVLLITQEIVPSAHEERNLQIREEEIKNESQQYYSRQTTPILGLGRDFAEWYRSKYGYGRLEVQDIEDLGLYSIQSEYEEFKSQFTRWCYDRHGLKEASTRKIEKLIKEFESYEQEQEEYPIREQIEPKFMIQDNFSFATSFKPESKEKKKELIQELITLSQGYAKQERLWIEEQWEYLEEKWPRYDYRVFQIGCCFQKKGDCTKAEAFYDLASKYQSIHLSLNLQSLKNRSNPALRSFYMFFERFGRYNEPTAPALSCLAYAIKWAQICKKESRFFRRSKGTRDMFFPVHALRELELRRDKIVFWHLSSSCKSRCISPDPIIQSKFAACLVSYFQDRPFQNFKELLRGSSYTDLGSSISKNRGRYHQVSYLLREPLRISSGINHYVQIRVKRYDNSFQAAEVTCGILRDSPFDQYGSLVSGKLYDENNEILKIGLLHGKTSEQKCEMPTVGPSRIKKAVGDCRNDFVEKDDPKDIMSNRGCGDFHRHIELDPIHSEDEVVSKKNYKSGEGLPSRKNNRIVHSWLEEARKGKIEFQLKLAKCYDSGENNVRRDQEGALYWYEKARRNTEAQEWLNIYKCLDLSLSKEKRLEAIKAISFKKDAIEKGLLPLLKDNEHFIVLEKVVKKIADFYEIVPAERVWIEKTFRGKLQNVGIGVRDFIIEGFCNFYEKTNERSILETLQEITEYKNYAVQKAAFKGLCIIARSQDRPSRKWFELGYFYDAFSPLLERFSGCCNEDIRRIFIDEKIARYVKCADDDKRNQRYLCEQIKFFLTDNDKKRSFDRRCVVECFENVMISDPKKQHLFGSVLNPLLGHQESEVRLAVSLILKTLYDQQSQFFCIGADRKPVTSFLQDHLGDKNEKMRWGAAQSLGILYRNGFFEKETLQILLRDQDKRVREAGVWIFLRGAPEPLEIFNMLIEFENSIKIQDVLAQNLADNLGENEQERKDFIHDIFSSSLCSNENEKKIIDTLNLVYSSSNERGSFVKALFSFFTTERIVRDETLICLLGSFYEKEIQPSIRCEIIRQLELRLSENHKLVREKALKVFDLLSKKAVWFSEKCLINQVLENEGIVE